MKSKSAPWLHLLRHFPSTFADFMIDQCSWVNWARWYSLEFCCSHAQNLQKKFLIQAKRSYQKASLSLLPRISEEYCVQLYLYFIIQSAVKFSKNRKYCLCRLFCERKWCRSLKHCYSTAILLSIVKYNEYNVTKKRRIIKCPFEKVGAKKQRKSIRKITDPRRSVMT